MTGFRNFRPGSKRIKPYSSAAVKDVIGNYTSVDSRFTKLNSKSPCFSCRYVAVKTAPIYNGVWRTHKHTNGILRKSAISIRASPCTAVIGSGIVCAAVAHRSCYLNADARTAHAGRCSRYGVCRIEILAAVQRCHIFRRAVPAGSECEVIVVGVRDIHIFMEHLRRINCAAHCF